MRIADCGIKSRCGLKTAWLSCSFNPHSAFRIPQSLMSLRPPDADFRQSPRAHDDGELAEAEALFVVVHARHASACGARVVRPAFTRVVVRPLFRHRRRSLRASRLVLSLRALRLVLVGRARAAFVVGSLLALLLCVGSAAFRHLVFYLGVNLAA